jgi:hypothetical protein
MWLVLVETGENVLAQHQFVSATEICPLIEEQVVVVPSLVPQDPEVHNSPQRPAVDPQSMGVWVLVLQL